VGSSHIGRKGTKNKCIPGLQRPGNLIHRKNG